MDGIVGVYLGTPIFRIGMGREPGDAAAFCETLKEVIRRKKGINVWIGSTYDHYTMKTAVTIIQDKFITVPRMEVRHVNGERVCTFSEKIYDNPKQKVLCNFYIEPVTYLKSCDEIFEELLQMIFPPKPKPEEVGDAVIALKCPCCGGSVDYKNMTCDYCGTKVLYKIKED